MEVPLPTCFECGHAVISAGYDGNRDDPPEPAYAECNFPDADEKLPADVNRIQQGDDPEDPDLLKWWKEKEPCTRNSEEVARYCPGFTPKPTGKCGNCKKVEIAVPEYLWPLRVSGYYGDYEVCSHACQKIGQKKADEEIAEILKRDKEEG